MTSGTMNWTRRSRSWSSTHHKAGHSFIGWYMTATHTLKQWALHLQHQNCCKLLFTMSNVAVLRMNMGRNMRLKSCIWIRAITSDDDIVLHATSNSCNKVTPSLTSLDSCLRTTMCIHRKYGSKVCRTVEPFGLISKEVKWYDYSMMADQSHQQNLCGFLQYIFMMQLSTLSSILLVANIQFMVWEVLIASHLPVTLTLYRCCQACTHPSFVICSYAAILLRPQPPTKDLSKLTIEDLIPIHCHESSWRPWCCVDFGVHSISYNIPVRGMILQSAMQNTGPAMCIRAQHYHSSTCTLKHLCQIHYIMVSKSTVWQGWQEDLLHHIWSAALHQSTWYHEANPWAVHCGCLFSWFPSIGILHRCNAICNVQIFKSSASLSMPKIW